MNMHLVKSKFIKQLSSSWSIPVTLEVRKYDRKVFYDNLWNTNPDLVRCRGSVFMEGTQVVFPMLKCFNYGENGAGLDLSMDTEVVAHKKLNGYMINLTHVHGAGWVVSTTGDAVIMGNETENKYLNMGIEYIKRFDAVDQFIKLRDSLCKWDEEIELTMTFEVCHPSDPHIVPEITGLHPICYQVGSTTFPLGNEGDRTETTLGALLELIKGVKHEGFMVYDKGGNLLFKLKSPYYLTKKWIQRGGAAKVWTNKYKERIDEEYYPVIQYLRVEFNESEWNNLDEQDKSQAFLDALDWVEKNRSHFPPLLAVRAKDLEREVVNGE